MHPPAAITPARAVASIILVAAAGLLLAACTPQPNSAGNAAGTNNAGSAAAWPFWPTRMEITPLTRIVDDPEKGKLIEVRIEFLDAQRFTTRAVGELTVEIQDAGVASDVTTAQTIVQNLREPAVNLRYFDVVTRTYLFRIVPEKWPQEPVVSAVFLSADGQELLATRKVQR